MLAPYQRILDGELDFHGDSAVAIEDPIAIGAVGGSGTRVMAAIIAGAGVAMASPINRAGDAMEWPPMRRLVTPEAVSKHSRAHLMHNIMHGFESLLELRRSHLGLAGRVCWKVPGTFLWLEEFADYFPRMQYIHLMRNGLDMAYSGNQNQAGNWSSRFGIEPDYLDDGRIAPNSVLEYWLRANEFALETGRRLLGERLLLVQFEALCHNPQREVARILQALGLEVSAEESAALAALVAPPDSLQRYRQFPWQADFSPQQLSRLEALGYTP